MVDLNQVTEGAYLGWKSPYQREMDLRTYGFVYRIRYKGLSKFDALQTLILEALFIAPEVKTELVDRFTLVQRAYWAFNRLARIYKVKRSKRFDIDCDLYTTPFRNLPPSVVTNVYDERTQTRYCFRLSDMLALTHKALIHAPDFFVEPLPVRNPYTNLPFTKAQLYHLYFAVKASPLIMPPLFHLWFLVHFDLDLFFRRNESILINYAIEDFVQNGSEEEHVERLYEMVEHYEHDLDYPLIVDDFPQEMLLAALSPYLHDYLLASYTFSPTLRKHARRQLRLNLIEFGRKNPLFGRRIYNSSRVYYVGTSGGS